MVVIKKPGKRAKYFAEIDDFPYAKSSLTPEAYNELKNHLEEKLENYYKQQRYIAMMLEKKEKKLEA